MAQHGRAPRPTWLTSDRPLARYVARPVTRFLHIEASGGLLLLVATACALVWANSPWSASYETVWSTHLTFELGSLHPEETLGHWVNDGLLALFFFVVGLEIKGELVTGQLSDRRDAALPAVAAIGGMVVPALIFTVRSEERRVGKEWGRTGRAWWGALSYK